MKSQLVRRFARGAFRLACAVSAIALTFAAGAATDKPWDGKRVAILGDSYSTFNDGKTPTPGYSPIGGKYYPDSDKGVGLTLNQMWYQQVVADLGGTIVTNCSWGSSCIITNRYKAKSSEYIHSFEHRARDLPKINFTTGKPESTANGGFNGLAGCNPDVVIVMGGLNDEWQGSIQTSPNTYVEVTPALLKSRAKQLFKAVNSLCPHASEKYFVVLNDSLHATGFSTSKDFRKVLIEAVNETSGWTLIDHGYAQMAKSDFNSDSHINLSGHTKYAKNVIATVRGTVGKDSVLWTGNDGAWTTGSNWSGGKKPTGISAVHFPSNKTLKVTVSGSNLSKDAIGATLTIGRGSSVLFTETATSGYVENWFNALQPYTFLEEGATAALEKPKAGANDNEIYLDGTSILFESDTTFKTYKGAKFKVTGATFQNPVTKKWSDNITLISDGGATGVYLASNQSDGKVYLENDNFVVQSINYGTVSYTKGPWVYFNVPGRRTTQICRGGSTIFASVCQISNGAVATLESSGTGGGKGSSLQLGSLNGLGAGSSITVKDGANMMVGYQFILGQYATTLNMSGASPLVEVTNGTGELNLSGGLTWKLRPLSTWSDTAGRINVVGSKSKATVGADVKYEIDVSDIVPLTAAKKFCLVAATNKTSTAKRTLNLPAAGNVTLTGTSAGDYKATFSKDTYRMYVTIEPAPKQEAVGGWEKEYTAAGVTYGLVAITNTVQAFTWTVPAGVSTVDILAVGGGGAGGAAKYSAAYCGAGGGGAGAFVYKEGLAVSPGQTFTVKVGKGGVASTTAVPGDGQPSWVTNATANIRLTAAGGGHGGGCVSAAGGDGGCGGGGYGVDGNGKRVYGGNPNGLGNGTIGGTGLKTTGTVRIVGGGGGGAGFAGPSASSKNGCNGGDGLFCRITGESVCYGGGGGGAAQADSGNTGSGGKGGGGKGGDEGEGVNGTDGLGGGGGGGSSKSTATVYVGGNGGSGIVYIRYVKNLGTAAVPSNLAPNGVQINVHNAQQKEFLAMSASTIRSKFADATWRGSISKEGDCLPLPVTFSWTGGGINTVKVYNADGSLFLEKTVRGSSTELWGFDIGTNYTWEVVNSVKGASARASFTTEMEVPRMFRDPNFDEVTFDGSSTCTRKLDGVINMRELGGYTGLDGKRIKSGRLIRTARLSESSSYGRDPGFSMGDSFVKTAATSNFWLNTLKIKTQVDLRDPDEYGQNYTNNEVGVLGPTVRWIKFTTPNSEQAIPCYDKIFTEHGKANYKLLLDVMLNPANHPVVFHCSAGKDRTGTLAYILEALLGVSDEDKFRDWVALVLSSTDTQFSPTGAYDPLVAAFNAYEGVTQNDKVVSFVKSLGISNDQIVAFRNAMLEGGYSEAGHVHAYGNWVTNAAPDCVTAGSRYRACTASGCENPPVRITENLPALGHDWGAWMTNVAPMVGVEGQRTRTCSRCDATEEETLEPLPSAAHPYTVTWTGAAGDGKWATAGNFDKPTATNDYYVIPQDATITMEKATPGASLTVAAGKTLTVNGTTTLSQFSGADGAEQYTVLEDGATLVARHKAGFRLTNGNGLYLDNNTTLRAENGCYMKVSKLAWGEAENVALTADGTGSQIKIETTEAYGLSQNSSLTISALNSGEITVGGGWNTCPWLDNGTPTLIAENGGKIGGVRVFKTPRGGARVSIGANSSVSVSGKTSTSEDGEFALGIGDELDLHGENPQLQIGDMDTVMTLGSGALVKLTPESSWSATEGRIQTTSAAAILSIGSGVAYEIDVSKISGGIADGASKTFCLASTISGVSRPQILEGSQNVTLVGEGASRFTCEFSTTEVTVSGKTYKTPSTLKITLTASVPLVKTAAPTAATGLKYTGSAQTGVASGANYDLEGDVSATDAGIYVATATPKAGFCWNDGTTSPIEIEWSIAQADNAWTTQPSVSPTSFEAGKAGAVTLNVGVSKFGTPTANYDAGQIAALPAGTHTVTVSVPETDNWKGLSKSITITVTGQEEPQHPYVVTWTGAAGDRKWATQGNWDKEWTSADTVRFNTDATAVVATATPGAALMIESGKTVTITGTAGVTANFTGATETEGYQAMGDGATLILDGGEGIRMENAGIRFGNDTTYRVINGCYSKISGLTVGDSKNVRFETDASHLKFDLASALSAGSEIVCRTENANGLLELGTATLTAGTVTLVSENCATNSASDLQDNDAVVSLSIGTNAVFRTTGGEDHLFHLGATAGSTLDFHGSSPKVQLSYCNSVNLGANLTVRLTPEAGWNNWTLIQKSSDNTSTAGTCTIASGVHYVIDTSALADVKNELSFFLYNSGTTKDAHNIAVPAAGNVQLTGPYAAGFEATFEKPGNDKYKLKITLTPKQVTQPTVDGEPVVPADVFTKANSQKSTIVYPDNSVTVSGTTPAQKIVFGGTTVDVPAYYTATKSGATVTIAFNGNEKPVVADGEGDTKAIVVGETSVSIHVGNAYATLWYRLLKATDLKGDWAPVGEFTKAEADFAATRAASESAAFYKVEVTDVPPAK